MTPDVLLIKRYNDQLAEKTTRLKTLLAPFTAPEPEVFHSPVNHYRMRAEFRIWHDANEIYHIMFDQQTKQRLRVDQFPAASKLINRLMCTLIAAIKLNPVLRHKLFQIDYLSTQSGKIITSLLYHRKLDEAWQRNAEQLRDDLRAQAFDLQLIGRASKMKIMLDQDFVDEVLPIAGRNIIYRQMENSFTQPNAAISMQMLEWALKVTADLKGGLLELYCGNGNFSLALARNFERVLAIEIAKPSVTAALYNISANQVNNVQIIRMAAEDFSQAMNRVHKFNRLKGIDLCSFNYETILVNPQRSGLDTDTIKMMQAYPRILYISCNPKTLCANLAMLQKTHQISRLALFDQFPYTQHIECGVVLKKRT